MNKTELKRGLVFGISIVITGLLGTYFATRPKQVNPPAVYFHQSNPLDTARQATCRIEHKTGGGTGVVVSRIVDGDRYRYRMLTANHVVNSLQKSIDNDPKADRTLQFMFQFGFHDELTILTAQLEEIDWMMPKYDWASFIFYSDIKLPCAKVGTEKDFKAINAFDPIYIVGCGGPFGPSCREGVIAATHNTSIYRRMQLSDFHAWNQHPEHFFKVSMPIWWGDSGGAVLNKNGKLIGLIVGFSFGDINMPATHSGVATKIFTIYDIVSVDDFFLVED